MTNVDATAQAAVPPSVPEEDPLARVHRDLVGIHASMVEATRDDTTTLPWATAEIMGVIRYIAAVRKAQRAAKGSDTTAPTSSPLLR